MRKALIGVQIQPQVKLGAASDHMVEVLLQLSALKLCHCFASQLLKVCVPFVADIEARQLVIPGLVREASHGTPVDFFLLRAEPVLVEKHCKTFIQTRIVRVALDFAAQHSESWRNLFHLHQSRQVALENASVFRRTRTVLPRR